MKYKRKVYIEPSILYSFTETNEELFKKAEKWHAKYKAKKLLKVGHIKLQYAGIFQLKVRVDFLFYLLFERFILLGKVIGQSQNFHF